jgi:hypothetical protein
MKSDVYEKYFFCSRQTSSPIHINKIAVDEYGGLRQCPKREVSTDL